MVRHQSASLLPVMVDPVEGCLYFLLAKERYHASWPAGSHLWSHFGGQAVDELETTEHVAAREFMEETLGQVPFFLDTATTIDTIETSLQNKEYVLQVTHLYKEKQFVTYVVQIPWDPSVVDKFHQARHRPEAADLDLCFLEKSHIQLFSLTQALRSVHHQGYLTPNERCSAAFKHMLEYILVELFFYFKLR